MAIIGVGKAGNMNITEQSGIGAPTEAPLRLALDGAIARITLSRPAKYNVLSAETIAALQAALLEAGAAPAVRVIVLGAEGRAFSAGHDLTEMGADADLEAMRTLFQACSDLMMTIRRLPQPVIARVQGVATAAGCQLVAMCDLAVASSEARFAVSGLNLGLFCSTPAGPLSRNLLQKPALEMLLTGEFIDAPTARERGLVNRVAPPGELDAVVDGLAAAIAAKSPAAIAAGKRLFYAQRDLPIAAAYAQAAEVMAGNAVLEDARRGIASFTQRSR